MRVRHTTGRQRRAKPSARAAHWLAGDEERAEIRRDAAEAAAKLAIMAVEDLFDHCLNPSLHQVVAVIRASLR